MDAPHIQLKLFAGLTAFSPRDAGRLPIVPGISIGELLEDLGIPVYKAHLVFVDGVKQSLAAKLRGGERVGIFPPVAGG